MRDIWWGVEGRGSTNTLVALPGRPPLRKLRADFNQVAGVLSMKTRFSALPLVGAVSALLLSSPPALAGDFDGAIGWLPADTTTVVAFDFEDARKAPLFKDLEKSLIDSMDLSKELAEAKKETGIDLMTSIKSIVIAGADDILKKSDRGLAILEVGFDESKLLELVNKNANKVSPTKKSSPIGHYYQFGNDACVMFSGGYAIVGAPAVFEKALDAKVKKTGGKPGKLNALLSRVKGAKHGFAIIASSPAVKKALGKDFAEAESMSVAGVSLDFSGGLKVQVLSVFADATKASAVANKLKGELDGLKNEPDLKELKLDTTVSKISASSSGNEVKVELVLSTSEAQALAKSLKEIL